jgi:hypothetical protein
MASRSYDKIFLDERGRVSASHVYHVYVAHVYEQKCAQFYSLFLLGEPDSSVFIERLPGRLLALHEIERDCSGHLTR